MTEAEGERLGAIPSTPRQPTWRASLRPVRAFVLVATVLFAIAATGVVFIWGTDGFASPFVDGTLDELRAKRAAGSADAIVERVEDLDHGSSTSPVERVHYVWSLEGRRQESSAYADSGTFEVGRSYGMEYLPDDPTVNRLVGSTRSLAARSLAVWLTVAALATALWLFALRQVLTVRGRLRDGPCALAQVEGAAVRGRSLDVELRFAPRGAGGEEIRARGSLPREHPLARELRHGEVTEIPVIHGGDGRSPLLVTALDFEVEEQRSGKARREP